uniref:Uncharacterized protein n=1 Tax=Coccidioides posadasii RMSCC 3488 TaxID=454284 RepID=A0A0J6FDT8_COCPO|nr:hypothetical protein CPAG_07573 [Coccidioides posadasii RMSCC 3488]
MAVNKLLASLASATNELTLSTATLNLDFFLFRFEAPPSYRDFGLSLSSKRRQNAEGGSAHITARKLGALFENILPKTSYLVDAYGARVSAVIARPDIKPKEDFAKGFFAAEIGPDGTTIWAAATSGPGAVPVHLLACLLARRWNALIATSIWVELVEERKKQIATEFDNGNATHYSTLQAARQDISREQLAEWDAGARAWLGTADEVLRDKVEKQRLTVAELDLPIEGANNLFKNVMNTWKVALTTMENLLSGQPQRIYSGSALLGLSSWHIFPDLIVLGSSVSEIKFEDESRDAPTGLSFFAACMNQIASLHEAEHVHFERPCLATMSQVQDYLNTGGAWVKVFARAASALLGSDLEDAKLARLPIKCGQKHGRTFFSGTPEIIQRLFGFCNPQALLELLPNSNLHIDLLRKMVSKLCPRGNEILIRYNAACGPLDEKPVDDTCAIAWEFATAVPELQRSKGYCEDNCKLSSRHKRWAPIEVFAANSMCDCIGTCVDCACRGQCTSICHRNSQPRDCINEEAGITREPGSKPVKYLLVAGIPRVAALYIPSHLYKNDSRESFGQDKPSLPESSEMVPSATLAIRSICAPLYKARWIPPMAGLSANASHDLDRPRTFACIAMFESGHLNLDPYLLNEVFPMPSVDSLFISGSILCDPSEVPDQFEVHRVVGNVGRAGIALLIPPQAPQIKEVDIGSWNLLSHDKFDGEIIDSFPDVDAYLLESIVQVRDKGKWVADVDILKAVKPRRNLSRVGRYRSNDRCDHCVSPTTIDIPMTSIDTWEELLEGPERLAVARTHGN